MNGLKFQPGKSELLDLVSFTVKVDCYGCLISLHFMLGKNYMLSLTVVSSRINSKRLNQIQVSFMILKKSVCEKFRMLVLMRNVNF